MHIVHNTHTKVTIITSTESDAIIPYIIIVVIAITLFIGEKDWNIVIIECNSLANTWERLSGYLGLSYKEINKIKINHGGDCASCWNEALEQWISQNYDTELLGMPSWRSLLKSVALVDQRLCKELAAQHQIKGMLKYW